MNETAKKQFLLELKNRVQANQIGLLALFKKNSIEQDNVSLQDIANLPGVDMAIFQQAMLLMFTHSELDYYNNQINSVANADGLSQDTQNGLIGLGSTLLGTAGNVLGSIFGANDNSGAVYQQQLAQQQALELEKSKQTRVIIFSIIGVIALIAVVYLFTRRKK